jgi:hypothetical protein
LSTGASLPNTRKSPNRIGLVFPCANSPHGPRLFTENVSPRTRAQLVSLFAVRLTAERVCPRAHACGVAPVSNHRGSFVSVVFGQFSFRSLFHLSSHSIPSCLFVSRRYSLSNIKMPIAYKDDFIRSHIKNADSTTLIRGKYNHLIQDSSAISKS